MPRGLRLSHLVIANVISFVNTSNKFLMKFYLHVDISVAHLGVLEMIDLCLSMHGEHIIEYTNGKMSCVYNFVCKRKIHF